MFQASKVFIRDREGYFSAEMFSDEQKTRQ
jgi:hypothetical protein